MNETCCFFRQAVKRKVAMIVENTKAMRALKSVVATMAIEDMYFDEAFINEMIKVSRGEKTTEDIIQEIILEYGR